MIKKYIINNKDLIKEWNWNKNNMLGFYPDKITCGSDKNKVWWKCSKCGYEWRTTPNHKSGIKTKSNGCPFCSHKIVVKGVNDLESLFPEVAKKWHPTLNHLLPSEVLPNSNLHVWWQCSKNPNHIFKSKIYHMVKDKTNCPICANQKIISGINDLETTNPELLKEWDYEKNNILGIYPNKISYGNSTKVWWKCSNCGHTWKTSVSSRAGSQHTNCPICSQPKKISKPEKIIAFYLSKQLLIEENKKFKNNLELDIYIPKFKLGVEFDGAHWHQNVERDIKKDNFCKQNNIALIRVREFGCPEYSSSALFVRLNNNKNDFKSIELAIKKIYIFIKTKYNFKIKFDINITRDYNEILSKIKTTKFIKSIINSPLINEWNYEKNKNINPATILLGSKEKLWWKCSKCGYEWQAVVYSRKLCKCPYCSGTKTRTGINDLKTLYPDIANEWDYEKNKNILPEQFKPKSNKVVGWKCSKCGYTWNTAIYHRVEGKNCPKCGRLKTINSHFKKIINIETQRIYNNAKEACDDIKINIESIRRCCRGEAKTAGGYHWKYIDE